MATSKKLPKNLADVEKILGIDFGKTRAWMKAAPADAISALDAANSYNQYVWEKIIESINIASAPAKKERWWPDWLNSSQWKYCPWAWLKKDESTPSGLGFACTHYVSWNTSTSVGSRLLVENSENALYAIRTFPNEYLAMTLFAKEGL